MKMNKEVVMVKLSDIIPNRFQPRLTFDEEALNELASSIKEHGIIQPLILRDLGSKYEIIAGERRYKASTIAGLTEVPAIVGTMDDQTSAELALIENIQRKDLSAIEEAKSYKKILDMGNFTQEELAKRMGKSQSPTVVPQHAISFLKACIEAGTQPDFFVYPGEGHNMMGHQSVHLHERITQYFEDYLK